MAAGKKLLVADDSLTIQKVIRLALSNEGYEIQAISDGADAVQQIATFRPDCVLIDVSLPTRTAFEIKREVKSMEDHASTKFILMSSAFEKIDEAQASEVGFDGRLTKPFDPAHLRQVLTEVLAAPAAPKEFPKSEATSTGIFLEPPGMTPDEDELWGKHEEPQSPPPIPEAEIPEFESGRDEIKQLTESTIRMSGLAKDDFEWAVNEPSLKPPASMSDMGESAFQLNPPAIPNLAPPSIPFPNFTAEEEPPAAPSSLPPLKTDRNIEDIVRRQVQETLEKMARQIIPEVAERVIKAEINKLLNEKH